MCGLSSEETLDCQVDQTLGVKERGGGGEREREEEDLLVSFKPLLLSIPFCSSLFLHFFSYESTEKKETKDRERGGGNNSRM